MSRAEWNAVLDSAPLTANQRGAIMRESLRLGLDDRAERLAVFAVLLGNGELGSTGDLTQGEAGRIIRVLMGAGDRAELLRLAAADIHRDESAPGDGGQGDEPRGLLARVLAELVRVLGGAPNG